MFNLGRVTRSSTSSEMNSLKNNISQLAKQFDPNSNKTHIQNDRKFWLLENNHSSKIIKERDNTIKSLKKISRQKSISESESIKADRFETKKLNNKRSNTQLEKQIQRLNKVISKLNDKCERLQLTIKYQQQQIQIFENQNQSKKTQASINISQSKLRYEQMSQQIKSRLNSTTRLTGYGSSSSKNSFGYDTVTDQFNQNQDEDNNNDFLFKQSINFKMNSLSDNKNNKDKDNKQIMLLKSEVNNLKEMMFNMNDQNKISQIKSKQQHQRKQSLQLEQKQKYQQRIKNKTELATLLQRRVSELEQQKQIEANKFHSSQSIQHH